MARKCTDCGFRPQDTTVIGPELCTICLNYAEMENVHQDHGDDHGTSDYPTANCPVCHPELDTRYVRRTGHTNTAPKTWSSHAGCEHPRTPAARAACRKARTETPATETRVRAYAKKHHTDPTSILQAVDEVNQELKLPRLTRAQLASPIIQSMLRK